MGVPGRVIALFPVFAGIGWVGVGWVWAVSEILGIIGWVCAEFSHGSRSRFEHCSSLCT